VAAIVVDPGQHSGSKTSEIAPRNLHQAAIPGARLALYRGEGHMIFFSHAAEILSALAV
jgi:hypothetical protein